MTTPGPRHRCSTVPPAPDCDPGDMYSESCVDCTRCHSMPCACLREVRRGVFDVLPDDADLELPDELALGGLFRAAAPALDALLFFAPALMVLPHEELTNWRPELAGFEFELDSSEVAEALLAAEFDVCPDTAESSCRWCRGAVLSESDHDFCEPSEPVTAAELREWAEFTGCGAFSAELARAVANIGDAPLFAGEPSGHGRHAAGDTRCPRSNQRARVDAILRRSEREPERRGCPVRARAARRAAGGLARRAKPQGEGTS